MVGILKQEPVYKHTIYKKNEKGRMEMENEKYISKLRIK